MLLIPTAAIQQHESVRAKWPRSIEFVVFFNKANPRITDQASSFPTNMPAIQAFDCLSILVAPGCDSIEVPATNLLLQMESQSRWIP